MIAVSYSSMGDLECPFRFNALKIEKSYKEPENEAMLAGADVHDIISQYVRHCWTKGVSSDLDFFGTVAYRDGSVGEKVKELIERFKSSPYVIIDLSAVWVNIEKKYELDESAGLIAFGSKWSWNPKTAFRGVSDYAYVSGDTLHIVDWKTGYGDPDELQLKLYAYMCWLALLKESNATSRSVSGIQQIVCTFANLATGKNDSLTFTPTSCFDAKQIIVDAVQKANSLKSPYEAIPCAKCKYCTVPGCPVRGDIETAMVKAEGSPVLTIPSSIETREQAEKALLFIAFADSLTNRIKDVLRKFVEKNGAVVAGGKVAELRPNETWKPVSLEKLLNALVAYKVPKEIIWDNLSLTEAALEKILKKSKMKERLPLLLSMGERKKYSPKFGLYNDTL